MKNRTLHLTRLSRRLTALLLAGVMTLSVISSAGAITQADIDATAAQIKEMQAEQASLQSRQADVQAQLDDLSQQENSAVDQLLQYQQQAQLLENQIDNTKSIIADYEILISDTQDKLEAAQEKEAQYYDLFCERVRAMEENSITSYWTIIFDADNFSDLLDRIMFVREVMDYDNWVMDQLAAARQEVADTKAQLEEEKAAKETALAELEDQQTQVQAAYDQVEVLLAEIRANESIYASKMAELQNLSAALEDDIEESQEKYEAQIAALKKQIEEEEERKRKEEEERKRQEEEERKRQEEEERKKQEQANSSSSSGSDSSSGSSSSGSSNSSLGAQIAAYGCQFIGNPYVWGGTSLTNGCDCSGFVMSVYAHFGYSLPHSSKSLRSCGRGVSYSEAQPGDVICYYSSASPSGGHTGIYIGDGMMVNAASSKTGIIISSVNPNRSGFVVRRII